MHKINLEKVEQLASRGLFNKEIARAVGVTEQTFCARMKNPQFAEAVERGRAKGQALVANALFEKAITGDVRACEIYLKTRCGWTDKKSLDVKTGGECFTVAGIVKAVEERRKAKANV